MLFDEPYTGLDQDASVMLDDILRTVAAQGRTVVMTSHDLVRAEDLATRFDILSHGVVTASATRKEIGKSSLLSFYKNSLAS
jgi:ABC-type multidrug transport system ATPase subunit